MEQKIKIGNRQFIFGNHTYVMAILNVTPDSFSDGGNYITTETALFHTKKMIEEGADIIDIGGESTRPGYIQISEEEEISRVIPIIKAIKQNFDIPLSIDTYKAKVAAEAIFAGVDLVNDIWGLKYDKEMAKVIAKEKTPVCIMHNREKIDYKDFKTDIIKDLEESLQIADNAGISRSNIILDPGIGFGKSLEMNLECIHHLELFHQFKLPILLGTSRKSVIGLTLDLPVNEREEGTITTTVIAVIKGCSFVRVHNVQGNVRAIKMTEAVLKSK